MGMTSGVSPDTSWDTSLAATARVSSVVSSNDRPRVFSCSSDLAGNQLLLCTDTCHFNSTMSHSLHFSKIIIDEGLRGERKNCDITSGREMKR